MLTVLLAARPTDGQLLDLYLSLSILIVFAIFAVAVYGSRNNKK